MKVALVPLVTYMSTERGSARVTDGFERLGLPERALAAIHSLGWREPTPVQAEAIPHLLKGRDVVAEAETGSGKTGAFGFPLVEAVHGGEAAVRALVLVPTRELAVQVASDLDRYAAGAAFRAVAVYGGVPFEPQLAALAAQDVRCVVATPGRLLDFVAMRKVTLARVAFAVVDEADRLLDLGFLRDVEKILSDLPGLRQLAMFSATFPDPVVRLARRHAARPREIRFAPRPATPDTAEHFLVRVPSSAKRDALAALLGTLGDGPAIVFARKREGARDIARFLAAKGFAAASLRGDLDQARREETLRSFREGTTAVLVATDVASRGLDVPGVSSVVNFDAAEAVDDYVHRAGRTARAGRTGRVFTIVTEQDHSEHVRSLERAGVRLRPFALQGFDAPPPPREAERPVGPPKRKADKKRLKPGWEQRKGRR